jgi:hypothetical protein
MTLHSILGLYHCILLGRELDRAETQFRKLGFQLTPRGHHVQQPSQNHTAILADNYIELLYYPADLLAASRFATLGPDYEGPAAVALRPTDSAVTHQELADLGLNPPPLVEGGRPVDTPDGPRRAAWRNQRFPEDAPSLPSIFTCGHQTPELVYLPGAEVHPKGARRLTEMILVHPIPGTLKDIYARLFGDAAVSEDTAGLTVQVGSTVFRILTPAGFAARFPGVPLGKLPERGRFVGVVLAVDSTQKVAALLAQEGIATTASAEGGLVPSPDAASGLVLEFREAPAR